MVVNKKVKMKKWDKRKLSVVNLKQSHC